MRVAELIKKRIVVGHALHNDMKALNLTHPAADIRDTARCRGRGQGGGGRGHAATGRAVQLPAALGLCATALSASSIRQYIHVKSIDMQIAGLYSMYCNIVTV